MIHNTSTMTYRGPRKLVGNGSVCKSYVTLPLQLEPQIFKPNVVVSVDRRERFECVCGLADNRPIQATPGSAIVEPSSARYLMFPENVAKRGATYFDVRRWPLKDHLCLVSRLGTED